jgi:hypothetical protein
MKRWFWIVLAIFISTCVYFTIRYGLRPKPIPVMNATEFERLDQIGVVVYKRLHQNIRTERIVLLGTSHELKDGELVWSGLIDAAISDKENVVFFVRDGLQKPNLPKANGEVINFSEADLVRGDLFDQIGKKLAEKKLVIVHAFTPEISHLIEGSISQKLDDVIHHPVLSISALPLPMGKQEVDSIQQFCLEGEGPTSGAQRLACAQRGVARKNMKKNLALAKTWAVIERHGLKEYLIFIHAPLSPDHAP